MQSGVSINQRPRSPALEPLVATSGGPWQGHLPAWIRPYARHLYSDLAQRRLYIASTNPPTRSHGAEAQPSLRVFYFVSFTAPLRHAALTHVKSVNESLLRVSVGLRSGGAESGYPDRGEDRKDRAYSQFKRDVSGGFPHVLDSGLALYRLLRTLAHCRRIVFPSSPCRIEDEM